MNRANPCYVGGKLEGAQIPPHHDFRKLGLTPAELCAEFAQVGWRRSGAFQTGNPMHGTRVELTFRAAKQVEATLLTHPVVAFARSTSNGIPPYGDLAKIHSETKAYAGISKLAPHFWMLRE